VNILNLRSVILNFHFDPRVLVRWMALAVCALLATPLLLAQTVGTGSIVGVVADPQGKALAGVKVEITNKVTAAVIHVETSDAGLYSSGPIQPGNYVVHIAVKGFKTVVMPQVVHVGNAASGTVTLQGIAEKPPAEVRDEDGLNLEQATVQGVIKGAPIEELPIGGRSFPDLAQLEPGVQMQDGSNVETKNGLSSISLLSQFGRSERISLDGTDISDETVGGTTQNIPAGAIKEAQISQSLLDLSTGLSSSGAVNVITKSGSDQIHGGVFGVFRGNEGSAPLPDAPATSFQQELFGANAGGAVIKDKVFWFGDAERAQQNLTAAEVFTYPFDELNAILNEPYREFATDERVDWNMRGSTRGFFRFNYFQNSDLRPYGAASSTQQFRNTNNTLTNAVGVDFNTGVYAHSLRFEYLKLRGAISDATSGLSGADNPIPGLGINIGAGVAGNCILSDGGSYCGGPSWLAPQQNDQSDELAKYDGSQVLGKHVIRYGITFNRINVGRVAAFGAFPQVGTTSLVGSTSADPTSYPADWVTLGNGVRFSSAKSAFGFPGGGIGPDNRVEMYVGDAFAITPKLTLTYGLHYVHDSGRTDSGLGALPDLNQWAPGLGDKIRNPGLNVAPQFGFVWDAGGNGATVVRGGAGLVYANTLANSLAFDSPARLANGIFADAPQVCSGGVAAPFPWPTSLAGMTSLAGGAAAVVNTSTGLQAQPTFCGQTISTIAPQILALSSAFQAAAATAGGSQANPNFIGTTLSALNPSYDLLYPGYRTPRSFQMNLGASKELAPGTVLSLDYVRSIGEHFLIGQDVNHSGAARSFNQANAVAARDAAQVANGCATGLDQATCMIAALGQAGAQRAYSAAGLDSNLQTTGGGPCPYCAFPGTNPISGNNGTVGGVDMLFPVGRSVYSGWQMKLVQRINKPMTFVKAANFQVAYSFSHYVSQVQDQDFIPMATDNDDPTRFRGPNGLDRKHQISFGGTFDLPFYTRFSFVGHFLSPLPQNLELPEVTNGGEIFATDWLGSGLGSAAAPELVPETGIGQFQRATNIDNLHDVISAYNVNDAGKLTPAGECLAGLHNLCPGLISGTAVMTATDLSALGWVMPQLGSVAPHAIGIPWVKSIDLKASWPLKIKDGITIEPSASIYNVFNLVNSFLPGNLPGASLLPGQNGVLAPNVLGGITSGPGAAPFRTNFQSGTFAQGGPRQLEFGLRITF
jgi:carboxypeptidase family protein